MNKGISFKNFIETYNFRYVTDIENLDTKIVRIYFGDDNDWFEFGVYDFNHKTWERVSKVLSKQVLESNIVEFCYDHNAEVFCVWVDI